MSNTNQKKRVLFVFTLVLGFATTARTMAQEASGSSMRPTRLTDRVKLFKVHNKTWADIFFKYDFSDKNSAWLWNLTVGYATYGRYPRLSPGRRLNFELRDVTVKEILDKLFTGDLDYYWVSEGLVVNILPRKSQPGFADARSILERKLKNFEVRRLYTGEALSELVEEANKEGINELTTVHLPKRSPGDEGEYVDSEKIDLSIQNKSIRECLNAILAAHPPAGWGATIKEKSILVLADIHGGHTVKFGVQPKGEVLDLK